MYNYYGKRRKYSKNTPKELHYMQKIVENRKNIFNENGELTFGGWSKSSLFEYNKEVHPAENKITESDSYFISNSEMAFYLSAEITGSDINLKVILIDYNTGEVYRDSISKRMLLDPVKLPTEDSVGELNYKDKIVALTITNTVDGKYLKCDFIDFADTKNLFVKLFLKNTDGDNMNMVSPFEKNKTCFYFKRFAENYTASGVVRFGGVDYDINEENSFVYFAKCRYLLSRHRKFQMLSGSVDIGGHKLTINLASKVGTNRSGSENCYFVDDKLVKIGRTKVVGDDKSVTGKWTFETPDGSLELEFTPIETKKGYLACKCDKTTFVVGKLNGYLETDEFRLNLKDKIFHMIFTNL